MTIEQGILEKVQKLTPQQQEEVLNFIEFLQFKTQKQDIKQKSPEELGWPPGFFEETAGCLADDPIQRYPQGEYEEREQLE